MGNESRASRSRYTRSMWSFIRTQPFLQPVERYVSEYLRSQGAAVLNAGSINTCFITITKCCSWTLCIALPILIRRQRA